MAINTKTLSGFIEFLPEEQVEFDRMKSLIEDTYHQFGFTSIDTPLVERSEVLLAKGGDEADQQIYFVSNGQNAKERDTQALRFDLTVPLARYVSEHFNELSFPFRRCHIGKVYRGERAQKGRFREFYQCDIDVIGRNSLSIYYDAEILSIIYKLYKKLKLGKFTIKINNRKVLNGLLEDIGLADKAQDTLRLVDKADKISKDELTAEFNEIGVNKDQTDSLFSFMDIKGRASEILAKLFGLGVSNPLFKEGLEELKTVSEIMERMGVDPDYYAIDLSLARGLDYYTGIVFEVAMDDSRIGSMGGGGRYENLAGYYTEEKLPGVGFSIGLTRLFWVLRENGLLKFNVKTIADVVVVPETNDNIPDALNIADRIRETGKNVDVLLDDVNMKKKFQYVTKKDTPYAVIIRTDKQGITTYSFQYMEGDELRKEFLSLDDIVSRLSN